MKTLHLFLKRAHAHDRLCAVADGVYTIALTLLVLDLKVPEVPGITNSQLTTDLFRQIPNFVADRAGAVRAGQKKWRTDDASGIWVKVPW